MQRILLLVSFLCVFGAAVAAAAEPDGRKIVELPAPMKQHMLASMRDHLAALQEIQAALAREDFDKVEEVAEHRLGQSSYTKHKAAHLGQRMPEGMRAIGKEMHRAASHLALNAKTADWQKSIANLSELTQQCVTCHAAYRVN